VPKLKERPTHDATFAGVFGLQQICVHGAGFCPQKVRGQYGGDKDRRNRDASSAAAIVIARVRKNPPRKTSGTKTMMGVRVEPMSAGVSSMMALFDASDGFCPMERCTIMFSTITIASSITTPMQAACHRASSG
jgi:hypothetical protein